MSDRPIVTLDPNDFARRLAQASADNPAPPTLPCAPWDRWLLVALHRHWPRQQFVEQVVRERLSGSPELIAKHGVTAHPEPEGSGRVPGMPKWRYFFEGLGCSLTHDDGTVLDVDFDPEHGSAVIDLGYYESYLVSAPELGWPELLLRSADGNWEAWKASIYPLLTAGLIEGEHRVRTLPHVHAWCDAVSQAIEQADGSNASLRAIALAVEDYPLAATLGEATPALREAAERQIDERCAELATRITDRIGPHVIPCIASLRALDRERARTVALTQLERGPIDGVLAFSMRLLDEAPHPEDVPAVMQLLERLRGQTEIPAQFVRVCAVRHLLGPYRRKTVPEQLRALLLDVLAEDQRSSEGEAALLVYLLDRERGLARIRAGRNSTVFMTREVCGAVFDWLRGISPSSLALGLAEWLWQHEAWLREWEWDGD
jgi:hypothetical protein